jgi:archaeosine synthase
MPGSISSTRRPGFGPRPRGHCSTPTRGRSPPSPPDSSACATAQALRSGRLRELVETRQTAEPLLAELLRYTDQHLGGLLDERAPVTGGAPGRYVLRESFRRPEAVRFRRRILERYRPPASKQVLLLVPCSKTKPYRNSRSHRRFQLALRDLPNLGRLHTVSLTSPLGIVPRELEDVPPARHYDIPVTGSWDEAERTAVTSALHHLLSAAAYRSVLVHLDPAEYGFVRSVLPTNLPVTWTLRDDRPTSREALQELRDMAERALAPLPSIDGGPLAVVREELAALADFQFGPAAGERLFRPPVRLHGRPWFQRVVDGKGTDLATWKEARGLFQLTVAGGQRIVGEGALTVEVDPHVRLGGDLFTPGVVAADDRIRCGDAVLLTQGGSLVGVGEAELPGALMSQLPRGLAVRIRHRAHPAPETAPTAT